MEISANLITTGFILLQGGTASIICGRGSSVAFFSAYCFTMPGLCRCRAASFFLATSISGWWAWLHGRRGEPLPITRSGVRLLLTLFVAGVLTTVAYGSLLFYYTDAYSPYVDSAVLMFSVVAQFLC